LQSVFPSISPVEGAQMKSLYDLLGARENDDADALKKAFREAVKANHPDLHPGDPDVAERFREILAAHALLGDAKQRVSYDRLLQREREYFQLMLKRQQHRPTLARQRLRLKRMRTTAAVAAVGTLIIGYRLFAPTPTTTTLEISEDEHATTGAVVEKDIQNATVAAAVRESGNPPTAIAAAKVDGVQGNAEGNVDNASKSVEATGAKVMASTGALYQGEPRDENGGTEVPSETSKPRTDTRDAARVPIGANKPSADRHEDAKVLNEANELSDDAAAIVRFVMRRLRDGGDAQAAASRELAGPPATDTRDAARVPIGANKPSADKHEDAKVLNEANELSDDAAAIVRFVVQRLRDGGDAQAAAGRELAGPPANDANFYRERGIAAYGSGDFLGAIGNFDEAIRLNPNDAQSYNIRGNVWDELDILERALADYDEAIRINPNNPAIFHDRAIMWRHKGELDKALIDLERAIRFSFSDARIYCDRGLVWYENGHHDRAIADFNQAIKLDPNFAAPYINRGLILHRQREFSVAFADSKPIRVDPGTFDVNRRTNSRH
jgi:tetratricopeptide (TPR) repeat protein